MIGIGKAAWYMYIGRGTWMGTGTGTTVCDSLISSRSICVDASLTIGAHSVPFDSQKGLHETILLRYCLPLTGDVDVVCTPVMLEEIMLFWLDCISLVEFDSLLNDVPLNDAVGLYFVEPIPIGVEALFACMVVVWGVALLISLLFCCWFIEMFWLRCDRAAKEVDLRANCFSWGRLFDEFCCVSFAEIIFNNFFVINQRSIQIKVFKNFFLLSTRLLSTVSCCWENWLDESSWHEVITYSSRIFGFLDNLADFRLIESNSISLPSLPVFLGWR